MKRILALACVGVFLFSSAVHALKAEAPINTRRVAEGGIVLDPHRPAHASREVCNPTDPIVRWDAQFSNDDEGAGCNSFSLSDAAPGLRFVVVQGEKHSLTIRYPEEHPPVMSGIYDRVLDGQSQRCVTVSMPDGLMLQGRPEGPELLIQNGGSYNGRILVCRTATCHRALDNACCCESSDCYCFVCVCQPGCADCNCEGEDGGFWPAHHVVDTPPSGWHRRGSPQVTDGPPTGLPE